MNYVGYSAKYLKIEDFYTKLALIAHNCYQAISKTPDEIFIKNLIKNKHLAMCEHYHFHYLIDDELAKEFIYLNNPYIVFDCDEDIIGDRLLPAFLLIAFEMVYSVVKSSTTTRDIIFLDEVWKMMTNLECAKLVYNMIKIIRGYLGSAILATQEMNDFLRGMQEYGESVLNNTALVILLRMNENDLNRVAGTYKLSSDECEKILKFRHGDALVVSNGDKIKAHIIPSKRENDAFKDDTVVA